ncbi:hypothetical protein ABEW24_06400 [Paenibacillus jamilae]|uniref:hypothetical protein n=1 Tax=Paenibacillus TaxID=44249 RepID=UPI00077CD2E0|nr:hypothetical protein [Paenibacillus polymyxa]KYG93730.1 hypothetical protein AZE31_07735 [Paenibacillus polymyxa]
MSKRDLAAEGDLNNVEESGVLNGIYLLTFLHFIKRATLDEIAIGMYLFRFVNVMNELLSLDDKRVFMSKIPEWEKDNLDVMLSNVIIEKYNSRFLSGLKELLSRDMIIIADQYICLKEDVRSSSVDLLTNESFELVVHKAKYISQLMDQISLDDLKERIKGIVGGI